MEERELTSLSSIKRFGELVDLLKNQTLDRAVNLYNKKSQFMTLSSIVTLLEQMHMNHSTSELYQEVKQYFIDELNTEEETPEVKDNSSYQTKQRVISVSKADKSTPMTSKRGSAMKIDDEDQVRSGMDSQHSSMKDIQGGQSMIKVSPGVN